MYATRPLSLYRKDPNNLLELTEQEGPNSGYLAITDEESEVDRIKDLPFPQNKIVDIVYTVYFGDRRRTRSKTVWFIPVIGYPLSSNRYYVVRATGRHKGQAWTSSREEAMGTSSFGHKCIKDVKPRVFDHRNIYQQVDIFPFKKKQVVGSFYAKSVAPTGFPPQFLRKKWWGVEKANYAKLYRLLGASGLDRTLRMRLPELNFPKSSQNFTTVVVGKWYCPLGFIREGDLQCQTKTNSLFYKMTLEQFWEEIFECENGNNTPAATGNKNIVAVSASVQKESVKLFGEETVKDDTNSGADGLVWFRHAKHNQEGLTSLGLSLAIIEKMRWIQEIGGYVIGGEESRDDVVRVEKVEEFKGENGWKRFGCFVLVERFALRKMDGTLLLTYDYKHIHQIQSKWE